MLSAIRPAGARADFVKNLSKEKVGVPLPDRADRGVAGTWIGDTDLSCSRASRLARAMMDGMTIGLMGPEGSTSSHLEIEFLSNVSSNCATLVPRNVADSLLWIRLIGDSSASEVSAFAFAAHLRGDGSSESRRSGPSASTGCRLGTLTAGFVLSSESSVPARAEQPPVVLGVGS